MTQKIYAERTVTITRVLKAPRDLVWRAWTDPEHLKQWWGPEMFTAPRVEGEVKVGSVMHITMRGPEDSNFDRDFPMTKRYREIMPGKKLVFENDAIAPDGSKLLEGLTTVTFADKDGGTEMVMTTSAKALAEIAVGMLGGMEQGWSGSFDKLARYLEKA
jgi:uncharacterized protein YndB with AHSA1/START domain